MRSSKEKVFCVGLNKTGTTSLEQFMKENNFQCGVQAQGELLMRDYAIENWRPILEFCETADFFQDLPFSAPKTVNVLANYFPDAKYILTVRDSAEQWYNSLVSFHRKVFGSSDKYPPSKQDLMDADYRYKGFAWEANRALYHSPEEDPYQKEILIKHYNDHIENVISIFGEQDNLLIININDVDIVSKLEDFLGIKSILRKFPWLNKTETN
jgi:hypothetical protein